MFREAILPSQFQMRLAGTGERTKRTPPTGNPKHTS